MKKTKRLKVKYLAWYILLFNFDLGFFPQWWAQYPQLISVMVETRVSFTSSHVGIPPLCQPIPKHTHIQTHGQTHKHRARGCLMGFLTEWPIVMVTGVLHQSIQGTDGRCATGGICFNEHTCTHPHWLVFTGGQTHTNRQCPLSMHTHTQTHTHTDAPLLRRRVLNNQQHMFH